MSMILQVLSRATEMTVDANGSNQMNEATWKYLLTWTASKGFQIHPNSQKSKLLLNLRNSRFCLSRRPLSQYYKDDIIALKLSHADILGIVFQADGSFHIHVKKMMATVRIMLYVIRNSVSNF